MDNEKNTIQDVIIQKEEFASQEGIDGDKKDQSDNRYPKNRLPKNRHPKNRHTVILEYFNMKE